MGLLINRAGAVTRVVVGDDKGIYLDTLDRARGSKLRLRGDRLVHTHLKGEPLNNDDLTDLALLRLDLIAALEVDEDGHPGRIMVAHLKPQAGNARSTEELVDLLEAPHPNLLDLNFKAVIRALEEELARGQGGHQVNDGRDRALLISVSTRPKREIDDSLAELTELADSAGVEPLAGIGQRVRRINPSLLMGKGKLAQVAIQALQLGANLLLFDQELSPSQARTLARLTELRIIDRTQLILDIFAQRARSHEGKLQVEMAQLRYRLPYLADRDNALSRLTGGIGARGPGETKLEVDRRRVRDRLARLKKDLKRLSKQRAGRRAKRQATGLPVISIVGYTNAGKSTLLNALTRSKVMAEDRLFATLDPTTRRLRLPKEQEIIITDTVGFIRRLPEELIEAFRATLEELSEADLLLHLVDASEDGWEERILVVERLLEELDLGLIPRLTVFNKADLAKKDELEIIRNQSDQPLVVSATRPKSLLPLVEELEGWVEGSKD